MEKVIYRCDALRAVLGKFAGEVVMQEVEQQDALQKSINRNTSPPGMFPPCSDWEQVRCFSWRMQTGRAALSSANSQADLRKEADQMKAWRALVKQLQDSCQQAVKDSRSISKAFEAAKKQETSRLERQRVAAEKKAAKEMQAKETRIGAGRPSTPATGSGRGAARNEYSRFFDEQVVAKLKKVSECGLEMFAPTQISNIDLTLPFVVRNVRKFAEARLEAQGKFLTQLEYFEKTFVRSWQSSWRGPWQCHCSVIEPEGIVTEKERVRHERERERHIERERVCAAGTTKM